MIALKKYAYIIGIAGITACSTQRQLTLPEQLKTPAVMGSQQDTLSLAVLKQVFADEQLQQLIDTALQSNFDLQAAMQRIEAAKANLLRSKRAMLPRVDVALSAGVDRYGDYTLNGVGNFDTNLSPNISKDQRIPGPTPDYFAGLRSSWEADIWGKLRHQKQAAYERLLGSMEGQRLLRTQVVASVTGMYYELLALDDEREIIKRNITLQESALALVNIQKSAGRATELAVQQFHAQLLSTKALLFGVQEQIAALENQLSALLGRLPQHITRTGWDTDSLTHLSATGIPASLLLHRPDIQQAARELGATQKDLEAARLAFLPTLTITPYAGFNAFKANLLFQSPASLAWGILGGLTTPLFNQGQLKAGYNTSRAGAMSAFYQYQQAVVNGYQETVTALNKVDNQQQAFEMKKKEVMVLKQAVSTANTLFSTGYASYLEVITAQKSVLEAELAMINTRRNVYSGLVTLYRSLGGH
ncbi:efflux transporter outer membrane subunit [uncultured Chitinophaga sp.]|uniref:efflux transporter outer membrane subunit n=1 Tax=uncultured Chitinophaga sp. TaxID=339340 RepID=UPI0025E680E9|nr:efflux transporter outer membrane subunit [uncultured Chitinophaga sp.]